MTRRLLAAAAISACGAAFAAGRSAVGDSEVGLFVTPPSWAATGATTVVELEYTPLGISSNVVRLSAQAALGMCATLDACAERYWVPLFNYPDEARSRNTEFVDFYAGPPEDWADFDFTASPFNNYQWWSQPDSRHMTNAWSRIFPVVSDRLEDVRALLRSFATGRTWRFGTWWKWSSSLFGGADTVAFDWCDREAAKGCLRTVERHGGGLCLDWSCITNRGPPDSVANAVPTMLNLDSVETTNVFERLGPNGVGTIPPVTNLLQGIGQSPALRGGWLDYSNRTARISANDFGWMNRLLAMLDKTYHEGGYDGLPIMQFRTSTYTGHATMSRAVTNGVFLLSWDEVNGAVADLLHFDVADAEPEVSTYGEDAMSRDIAFEVKVADADASLDVSGGVLLAEHAEWIGERLAEPVAPNSAVPIRFVAFTDGTYGPTIELYALSPAAGGWVILRSEPVLGIANTVEVSSGAFAMTADCALETTKTTAPYLDLGENWAVTNSGRHVRPLPDVVAPGLVRRVNLQTAGRRSIDWTDSGSAGHVEEFKARASGTSSEHLDSQALAEAELIRRDCEREATERFGVDFSDVNPSQFTRSWVSEASRELMQQAGAEALASGRWSASITEGDMYLANTNGHLSIYLDNGGTNGWSELPHLVVNNLDYGQIYGSVVASAQAYVATNRPPSSLAAEVGFSAAVYWKWKNLPIEEQSQGTPQ